MADLNTDVRYIKGIGEQRAKSLAKLGINTLRDLVSYYPRSYEDRTNTVPIAALCDGEYACVSGLVSGTPTLSRVRRGMEIVKLNIVDDTGKLSITYFNQSYMKNQLFSGESYMFFGKVSRDGARWSMANPDYERFDGDALITRRIVPQYRLTAGVSQKQLMGYVRRGLEECALALPNALPDSVAAEHSLSQVGFAFENIHFPADFIKLDMARRRLIFEELFVLVCALTRMKSSSAKIAGVSILPSDVSDFYSTLPFTPTNAQTRAVNEVFADMASGSAMNRLIQGDVGSGKTLVAAAAVWNVCRAGAQAAFMAPTEILANQHFKTLTDFLEPLGVRILRLTGSMPAAQKRAAYAALEAGEADLVVGTHALISGGVAFKNLALVVTDEQHRFGVNQRAALTAKGGNAHTLVMSATPIPRTLALIIYGDLDLSVIDELPPGRQKADTFVVGEDMRERIYAFIEKQVEQGRQVFVVCAAIEENEANMLNLISATEHAQTLQERFPHLKVDCIHGKLKPPQKEAVMQSFVNGETNILVSTTVIEVGVDVPNASLIVIENAERFGLSQLHQLRGRIGRGEYKSYCVLFSDEIKYEGAQERLKVLESSTDGFKIAEEDLRLRGPGDFFGSRQHGLPQMNIANLLADERLLKTAQTAALKLLSLDSDLSRPENRCLKQRIDELFQEHGDALN